MAERTRSQVVAFRVTKAERRQIDTKVRSSGLSQQTYLLRAALEEPIWWWRSSNPSWRSCGAGAGT